MEQQIDVVRWLGGVAAGGVRETHISWVFRGRDTVWKLKKAVDLGYLDFTAITERRRLLERELTLNAPHAPGLYRDVVPVVRDGAGLRLGAPGEAGVVDWVLRLAPVEDSAFLDAMAAAGQVDEAVQRQLGDAVAAMHAAQPACVEADHGGRMRAVARDNAAAARRAGLDAAAVAAWEAAVLRELDRIGPFLAARAGLVRRAHGDLHLGNLLVWQGAVAPFDALEFDEALATIDPAYDLAFLLMDLERRVSRAAANAVLGRYVARTGDAGLVGGLRAMLSMRAAIRAHVAASSGGDGAGLLAAAQAYLVAPGPAVVVAVGGLMGSGKSTLARAVAPGLGPAPGALAVRSDEVRKRLFGVPPEQPLGPEGYSAAAHERTGAAVCDAVWAAAAAGHSVVADATFLNPGLRAGVAAAARNAGAAFLGVWLQVPLPELERRVAARRGDVSDAGVAVLRDAARAWQDAPPGWVAVDGTDAAAAREQVRSLAGML